MKFSKVVSLTLLFLFTIIVSYAVTPKLTKSAVPNWIRKMQVQPKAPNLEDIGDGYYIESIDYQVHLGIQTKFLRTVKVITENAGAENAGQVQISLEPTYQTITIHELYLLRDGKKLDRLDLTKFKIMAYETELSRSIYNGTYSAYLVLEDLRKDDKIVVSYSIKGFNPVFGGKFFDDYSLQSYEPIGAILVNYVVPKDRKLNFKSFKGAPAPSTIELEQHTSYYWEISGTEKVEYEYSVPYWHPTVQRVACSEFEQWKDVAKWATDVNPIPILSKSSSLAQFAEQLWHKAQGDSLKYVTQVVDFVQNEIRYMGIEVGEYSHRANNPQKVFLQRYGDCKDKSVLLAAILQYKGIKSKLILVNSYQEYKLDESLPSPGAFNHMVMQLSIDGRIKYIDPTITNQGGLIHNRYFPFYGKILPLDQNAKLYDTDKQATGHTRVEEKFKLAKDGSAVLEVLTTYTGSYADNMRSHFKQTAKNQIEKSYLEYYQGLYKTATKKSALTFKDDMTTNTFRTTEMYAIEQLAERDPTANKLAVSLYATNLSSSLPEIVTPRKAPIALSYPLSMQHEVSIINPDGVHIPVMRDSVYTDRKSYSFGKSITTIGDTIKITFNLNSKDTYVSVDDVQNFITDFENLHEAFTSLIYLDDDGFVTGSNTHGKINWWSVAAFCILLGLFSWLAFKYYHNSPASSLIHLYKHQKYNQIGGWLILPAIGLFFSPLTMLIKILIPTTFSQEAWATLDYNVSSSPILYASFMIFGFVANTLIFFTSVYCFYLLITKRDIFPQTYFALLLFQIFVVILDTIVTYVYFSVTMMRHSPIRWKFSKL